MLLSNVTVQYQCKYDGIYDQPSQPLFVNRYLGVKISIKEAVKKYHLTKFLLISGQIVKLKLYNWNSQLVNQRKEIPPIFIISVLKASLMRNSSKEQPDGCKLITSHHLSSPLWILHSHQIKLKLEVLGHLGKEVNAEAWAAPPLRLVVSPTPDAAVHVALVGHVVRPGDVDEGRLLQVADGHVELLRDAWRGDVALPGPDDVLDVQAVVVSVPGPPGSDLLPLLVRGGALRAPSEVHDAQLDIPECARLGEAHLGLARPHPRLGTGDVPSHHDTQTKFENFQFIRFF